MSRLADGRIVVGSLGREGTGLLDSHRADVEIHPVATGVTGNDFTILTTQDAGQGYGNILGQQTQHVGDLDGDGSEDLVLSVFAQPQTNDLQTYSAAFLGPFPEGPTPHTFEVPGLTATALDDVAWQFDRCDVNVDGLNDLCSTRGVALAPPPFAVKSTFADGDPADRLVAMALDLVPGLLVYRHAAATMYFLPSSVLPPAGETTANLATLSALWPDRVLAMDVADVLPAPGEELVTTVNAGGQLGLVVWGLGAGLPELYRTTSCFPADDQGALAIADYDHDGSLDVAFAAEGHVGVLKGPPTVGEEPVWWTAEHPLHDPELPFGFSLLPWDDGDLMIGYPGRLIGTLSVVGYSTHGGGLYRVTEPLLPVP